MGALPSQPIDMSGRPGPAIFGCLPRQPLAEQGTSNLITSWSFARPWCRLQSGSSPVGTLPSTQRNTRHDREAAAARSKSPTKLDKPGAPHAPRDHTARPTPSRYVGRTVTRARRARAGGEEVEAPPHSVASAPRSAAHRPGRELGRIRPGTVRSTRGDSGRPPGSPRTGRRDQVVVPLSRTKQPPRRPRSGSTERLPRHARNGSG